jgi:hypothetical protein
MEYIDTCVHMLGEEGGANKSRAGHVHECFNTIKSHLEPTSALAVAGYNPPQSMQGCPPCMAGSQATPQASTALLCQGSRQIQHIRAPLSSWLRLATHQALTYH